MDFLFNYNDILSYYNKKINEKTNFTDLQPSSELYDQIQNDTRLGCWHKEELKNIIRKKGKSLIEILKSIIFKKRMRILSKIILVPNIMLNSLISPPE